jgi:hypothetical protein
MSFPAMASASQPPDVDCVIPGGIMQVSAQDCADAGGDNLGPIEQAPVIRYRYCSTSKSDTTVSYATGVVTSTRHAPCAVANRVRRVLFSYSVATGAALCLGTSTGYCPQALPDVRRLRVGGRTWRRSYLFDDGGLNEDARAIYRSGRMTVKIVAGVIEP